MKCQLPEVRRCCCCMTLETGTKVIGFIHLIFSVIFLMLIIRSRIGFYMSTLDDDGDIGILEKLVSVELSEVGATLQLVFGIYLLIGIYEKKTYLLFSWVIYECTSICLSLMLILNSIIFSYYLSVVKSEKPFRLINPEQIVEETLLSITYTYLCIVVYSSYKNICRNNQDQAGAISWRKDSSIVI